MAKTPPITNATAEEHNAEESNIESNLESNFITIGDLAKQLGVTTRTIRYYEAVSYTHLTLPTIA